MNCVLSISNFGAKKVDKTFIPITNHKFKIILKSSSIVQIHNDDGLDDEFPMHNYIPGDEVKNLMLLGSGLCIGKYNIGL